MRNEKRKQISACSVPANANPKFGMNIRPHCRGKTFFDRCKILEAYLVIHFCVTIIKQIMG